MLAADWHSPTFLPTVSSALLMIKWPLFSDPAPPRAEETGGGGGGGGRRPAADIARCAYLQVEVHVEHGVDDRPEDALLLRGDEVFRYLGGLIEAPWLADSGHGASIRGRQVPG
eukprot:SAG25_NODE_567_length_6885_cov_9.281757_11_plen_114_part_00